MLMAGFTVLQAPPTITSVNPDRADQGETLDVVVTGTYLTGATAVSFGGGTTVNGFTVDSPTQITANITIYAVAATGARDVSVTTAFGTGTLSRGIMVEEKDNGSGGGCGGPGSEGRLSGVDLIIGCCMTGLCWGTGYYLARRAGRRKRE